MSNNAETGSQVSLTNERRGERSPGSDTSPYLFNVPCIYTIHDYCHGYKGMDIVVKGYVFITNSVSESWKITILTYLIESYQRLAGVSECMVV